MILISPKHQNRFSGCKLVYSQLSTNNNNPPDKSHGEIYQIFLGTHNFKEILCITFVLFSFACKYLFPVCKCVAARGTAAG